MSESIHYKKMVANIAKLKKVFCTSNVVSKPLNPDSQLMLRAYLVLVHAEFETFFETIVREKVENDLNIFRKSNKVSRTLSAIVAFLKTESSPASELHKGGMVFPSLINLSAKLFRDSLNGNHGIKEKNIVPILVNMGIDLSTIDELKFLEVNTFGEKRGEIAHNSSIGSLTPVNLADEEIRIQRILESFKEIEELVRKN